MAVVYRQRACVLTRALIIKYAIDDIILKIGEEKDYQESVKRANRLKRK